ncbi:Ada metal-binding domain-containing protein [Pseudoduganella plicata]|uniref:Ada DNA repair metal-binding domain-containing protein n=1 Tax=Pseudoduganella plicata TaxID=321984 RepID=A0ABX5SF51_9BURK|nr:Ada metal-binding domain-containing protein [Pseudoduganella plicata]QBQ38970.1 hypothetical protein E1742_24570 [Pseudoduganella plicata]
MDFNDHITCHRAIQTRDARFDGRLFIGVTSTGIYCRPICPARTPRVENCRFYPSAAAAQQDGFRPCLRCRPESAPGGGTWRGSSDTVARALALLAESGPYDEPALGSIAARCFRRRHVSSRPTCPRCPSPLPGAPRCSPWRSRPKATARHPPTPATSSTAPTRHWPRAASPGGHGAPTPRATCVVPTPT